MATLLYMPLLGKPISESWVRHQLRSTGASLQMVVHTFRRKNTEAGVCGLSSPSIHSGLGSHLDGCWI
jgi:hypothetical protein